MPGPAHLRRLVLAAGIAAAAGGRLAAQTPGPPAAAPVSVEVTVTSLSGDAYVDGLTAADFRVWEDGREQRITALAHDRRPLSLCVVVDAAGAMEADLRRALATAAASAIVQRLDREDEVSAVVFRRTADVRLPWTRVSALGGFDWGDATDGAAALVDGLGAALRLMRSASNPRRAIVLLTDGEEDRARVSFASLVRSRLESEVALYALQVGVPAPGETSLPSLRVDADRVRTTDVAPEAPPPTLTDGTLDRLAADTGGTVVRAVTIAQIERAARNLVDDLRREYTLRYIPSRAPDGRYRRLRVTVARRGTLVRHRGGYLALPPERSEAPATVPVSSEDALAPKPPAAAPAIAPTARPADNRQAIYEAAVNRFARNGALDAAFSLIGAWSRDDVEAAVTASSRAPRRPVTDAAALFHLEVALQGAMRSPNDAMFQLELGERLLAPAEPGTDADGRAFAARWYAAAASVFLAQTDTERTRDVLDRGLRRLPEAAALHALAGTVETMEALRYDVDRARDMQARVGITLERQARLALAERAYRQALRLDEGDVRARLGLGYVLFLEDKTAEAAGVLETARAAAERPGDRYLSTLFLARVVGRADRTRARALLEAVAHDFPDRQSGWLALAQLEHDDGRPDAARRIVREHAPATSADARDEWSGYTNGALDEEALSWLRGRVR
ncbi:MAG: VWA domain-containing protein [Vicinamibacterales bacterium]